jgi:regulator of replication initiation timing
VAVISLYANKIYYIRTLDNTSPNGTQTVQDTATSNLSNHISDSSVREQMDKLVKENQDLKQRLGEYEAKSKQSQVTSVAQTKEEKQEESSSSSSESSRSGSSPVSEQELVNPTP